MASAPLSLRRNFSWTLAGNLVYAACLWGMLAVLTKLGSKAIVGRFALASAIATPIVMFASLQLRSVIAADAAGRYRFGDYLTLRLVALPLALAVVAVVAATRYTDVQVTAVVLFGMARVCESFGDIWYGLAQQKDRMDIIATSRIIKGLVALVLFGATFAATRELDHALVALGIAWLATILAYDIPRIRSMNRELGGPPLRPTWDPQSLAGIVWLTLPLGFVILLGEMRQTIPRTVLEAKLGEEAVGVFAALSYLVIAGGTVAMALGQASLARLSQHFAEGRLDSFRRIGWRMVLIGLGLGVGGVAVAVLAGPFILTHLYTAEYAAHGDLLVLIMAAGAVFFVTTLVAPLTTAMQAFRSQMLVQAGSVAVLAMVTPGLVADHGMMGAAWAALAASTWTMLGFAFVVWWGLRRRARQADTISAR